MHLLSQAWEIIVLWWPVRLSFNRMSNLKNKCDFLDWIKLKNRKYMGQLTEQYIRSQAKPFIVEVDQETEQKMFVSWNVIENFYENVIFCSSRETTESVAEKGFVLRSFPIDWYLWIEIDRHQNLKSFVNQSRVFLIF